MTKRVLLGLFCLICIFFTPIHSNQLTSLSKAEELKQIHKLKLEIDFMKKNLTQFYNYSIICGGKRYEARADQTFTDRTIPENFKNLILETYLKPENRANKCPQWSYNVETQPRSGGMESLLIPENTKLGHKVYFLLALDPESQPLFYFIRKAESEDGPDDDPDDVIFKVNVIKMGNTWIGEVILDKELDYEKRQSYNYLAYAYDGANLLEKYSTIEITDVDDEKPEIVTLHSNYNLTTKQFEFKIFENTSIGEVINPDAKIEFQDPDTQNSQLHTRLTNYETTIADSPFSLNSHGELRLISNLDYETQKEHVLLLTVTDTSGGSSEQLIKIEVLDVPDLPPRFIEPKNMMVDTDRRNFNPNLIFNRQFLSMDEGYVLFYENMVGPVFDVLAISGNNEPLGDIKYELLEDSSQMKGFFELKKHSKNNTWYLDCIVPITLEDQEDRYLYFKIRAMESADEPSGKNLLFTDRHVTVKVINGDMCLPVFDKELYEFEVVENVRQLLEPIYVSDCDHGVNGRINLSTSHKDFSFKLDQVYRYSKLGLYMAKSYDYEENITVDGHIIEFEIIARGSEKSLNKYETRSVVRLRILDINEFKPRFVLPAPAFFLKDGIPTEQQQRIFMYNVLEGQDFVLDVRAEDRDKGGDGDLFYFCRYLHPDDTFQIIQSYNSTTNLFSIRIPSRYFDSTSKIPITFAVFVQDSMDDLKLRSEIIIYLKPQSAVQRAAYFEFSEYEFKVKEGSSHKLRLKLINENLSASKIQLEELADPLNLFSPEFEETWISKKDMIAILENDSLASNEPEQEVNSDLFVILYPTDAGRDFDQLFLDNNKSDIYEYKLRAKLVERSDLFNDVTIYVKLIDLNDNQPQLANLNLHPDQFLNATLDKNFYQHTLLNINSTHFIPKVQDKDFSDEFGLKSLYCRINDTRFYLDHEYMSAELENQFNSVSILVRVLTNPDNLNKDIIWLNVTCEDNYFNRKSQFNTNSFIVRLSITETKDAAFGQIFNKTEYVLNVDENWIGPLAHIGNVLPNVKINYKIDGFTNEQTIFLNQHLYMDQNQLVLRQPLDYENSDKIFNFTITANLNANLVFRTNVIILVNDINDEIPTMSQNELSVLLNANHNTKGQIVASLFATDLDKQDSENGLKFESHSDKFTLKKIVTNDKFLHGVEIVLAEELTKQSHQFLVTVTDSNSQSDKCNVTVTVKNEKIYDELKWSEPEYQVTLSEGNPAQTVILGVNVIPVGLKSPVQVSYQIVGENPFYEINEQTGEIKTTDLKLDRENPSVEQKFKQSTFFVQAHFSLDSTKYWSNIQPVSVKIEDENDEVPLFVQPSNNLTTVSALKPDQIYQFQAIDLDKDDTVVYTLINQSLVSSKSEINLPFRLDTNNGSLSFNISELSDHDYLTLLKQDAELSRIKLVVRAEDSDGKYTDNVLFVDLSIRKLIKRSDQGEHLTPIVYKLEPKIEQLKKINDSSYSIEESVPENTIIAELGSFVTDHKLPMSENFKIETLNDTLHNPELYFRYDYENSNLKLIRRLDHDLVTNLSLVLVTEDNFRVRFDFDVLDVNDKIPELEMDEQEMEKFGQNLIIVSVDNLEDYLNSITKTVSSTPIPPRKPIPAMPELGLPERPLSFIPYITNELDRNRDALVNFDNTKLIKAYTILDTDKNNKFEANFDLNVTSPAVARSFSLSVNGTHVLIEKNDSSSFEDQALMEENLHNRFRIELSDGKNKNYFNGEVYKIDARQLQRLSTYVPRNGRYRAELYRSAVANTKISLDPMIQIENPFPYDIFVKLNGKFANLFNFAPKMIQSSSNVNFGPTEILLSLNRSLEDHEDILIGSTSMDLSVHLYTKNDYLNILMDVIGKLKISINLKNENKHQPRIEEVLPAGRLIELDEGVYLKKEIASIKAYDRDKGDPGRIEYFLIGNSNLLEIDSNTGKVYLNGTLDSEAEQLIVFFCYARDLAPAPFGRNSELQRFEIRIKDVNEFTPVIQPGLSSLTLKEATFDQDENLYKSVDNFRFDCYDRDLDSELDISLSSIQYVSKHDTMNVIDAPKKYNLNDLFRLVYQNSSSRNYKSALLAYTNKLDYEKLFRPNETLIRIDVSCSDGEFETVSKLIVKVEDENDNAPAFASKDLVISKDESNLLESIVRVEASDQDLSAQYGNQSLKYRINKCSPDTFDIFIDERTGEISSKLLLEFDTDEVKFLLTFFTLINILLIKYRYNFI
ncbi:Cadherin [Brachionus plicatilis]|uniref:Cadherin n=1 Tax=Brachionus plicatilis TaxID=10195 RepID=A0A3M7PR87_BRAPC|nr:Cadherin [Brachionus plicatilis]